MLSYSAIALILNNLVPLFGAVFLSWNFSNIIFLYWFENIVIGFFTVIKMLMVKQTVVENNPTSHSLTQKTTWLKTFYKFVIVTFFTVHFGAFTFVHGVFLLAFFGEYISFQKSLLIAILAMFLSHGISLIVNYIKSNKFLKTNEAILMFAPYPRIIVVHLTVMFAGFVAMATGFLTTPKPSLLPLIFFVLLKTLVDLASHVFEHSINNQQKIHPKLENILLRIFKTSLKTGKWAELAEDMDPEDRKKVEDFYRERGIDI